MEKKIKNFGRFYVLARRNPDMDKESLVSQFTGGRTVHLREMRPEEYCRMCDALEFGSGRGDRNAAYERLRHLRSSVLVRLGRLGVSTVDNWDGIDAFCMSERISGKKFRDLTADELQHVGEDLREEVPRPHGGRAAGAHPQAGEHTAQGRSAEHREGRCRQEGAGDSARAVRAIKACFIK